MAVCSSRILSRVWRRNRKATKLTRTVLLFILRPTASFAVPPSYTLVCALVTVSVCPVADFCVRACVRRSAGFCNHYCGFLVYTPYCGFLFWDSVSPIACFCCCICPIVGFYCGFVYALLRASIHPFAGFYTPCCWILYRPVAGFYTPCCGFLYPLLRVSIRPVAGFYTPCCGFLYALLYALLRDFIRPVAGFYTPCCGFLYALLRVSIRPVAGLHALCCRFLC